MTEKLSFTEFAVIVRDSVHNLDLERPENRTELKNATKACIKRQEDFESGIYDDGKGNLTIGYGFNMNEPGAQDFFDKCFRHKYNIKDILSGKQKITREDADKLLDFSLKPRIEDIIKMYKEADWKRLRANEQIAIICLYYNCPALVRGPTKDKPATKFFTNIKKYIATCDEQYLKAAVYEIEYKSNPPSNGNVRVGIQNARNAQAALLDSTKSEFYSSPCEPILPDFLHIIPGETVVPRGADIDEAVDEDSPYFIWRTQLDSKVRPDHAKREGKLYRKDESDNQPGYSMGRNHGCRCYCDEVTENIIIQEKKNHQTHEKKEWGLYNNQPSYYDNEGCGCAPCAEKASENIAISEEKNNATPIKEELYYGAPVRMNYAFAYVDSNSDISALDEKMSHEYIFVGASIITTKSSETRADKEVMLRKYQLKESCVPEPERKYSYR
jgi:GH24 family phage-related lysozyme (muramidase)